MRYQIEYSKKDNGWITKYETKTYKYLRISNSPAHSIIEDAENWIKEYDTDHPWIDHKIDGHTGHLMKLDEWKECCDEGGFIDYDGYGDTIDSEYNLIGNIVKPSDYTKLGGKKIPIDTKYILWYNR
jgi:hypothetical protein